VMTVANELLNAGNSPAQLARQCVRYLRNAMIAKIAGLSPEGEAADGLGSELLQISPDEQRRAARTAALFSEEELTRFLQVMLRTFDELGYRQEQRFHFELGLLKLVHLRRLLPLEEALSQSAGAARPPASTAPGPRTAPTTRPATAAAQPIAAPQRAAFSPFEQDRNRRGPQASSAAPISIAAAAAPVVMQTRGANAVSMATVPRLVAEHSPVPSPVPLPEPVRVQPMPSPQSADDIQRSVVEALAAAKQSSAADAMGDAAWTIVNGEASIQTELSKTMLPVVMNAEAEKILRATLRAAGILKVSLLPGVAAPVAEKKARAPRSGSVQAKASEHPMVQQAQRLFEAEIQTVIDLREAE
jgi:DNA polymerase-3 subunit gamma/tau